MVTSYYEESEYKGPAPPSVKEEGLSADINEEIRRQILEKGGVQMSQVTRYVETFV